MSAVILRGDAASLPLADESVDLVITSPPYWALRSYTDGGEHYAGQIGSEATPREFLDALLACTREWIRVLKPSGSMFINLGDKYSERSGPGHAAGTEGRLPSRPERPRRKGFAETGVQPKSLMGMPWRYALGCVDDLGLILRAEIIWAKPNGLPESVTDRVRRSHEQIFHMTKLPRYYSAVDEVRQPHAEWTLKAYAYEQKNHYNRRKNADRNDGGDASAYAVANPLGKLPGSVWEIPSQPLTVPAHLGVDHFAAFPMELPRRIILGWSPPGICTACGEGRRPVVAKPGLLGGDNNTERLVGGRYIASGFNGGQKMWAQRMARPDYITGYACACPDATAPTRPGVVLDPFGGTGTTALVAAMHGRTGISVDRSADYCRLARWRVSDPAERAKAMCVPKPPPVADGQVALFGAEAI